MAGIQIVVRDGRSGRDRSTEDHPVLMEYEADRPVEVDDRLTLPDGTEVKVIGGRDQVTPESYIQTVFVGNAWG